MLNNLNIFQSSASKEGQNQKDGRRTVADFVKESPRAVYTFDSERDAPEAELCRQPPAGGGRTSCIKVAMASKELFQYMQVRFGS
ncbi:hypothetical protein FRB99_006959 [Tulasnella sp. 403]|nr:hypothetical protein FRB99_006959 [Tulasnella sp. 403]